MTETWATDENGLKIKYNYVLKRWEYEDGTLYIDGRRTVCPKCNKPRLDINGVDNCDFCLQSLTTCDFINNACCGHGNDDEAYISLKDGRLFVLSEWSVKE